MHISNECNDESRAEYEMFNKQPVITEIYCEKAKKKKKVINFFRVATCEVKFCRKSREKKLSTPNV